MFTYLRQKRERRRLKNRVFCFVGTSGSGKTTILEKIIPLLVERGYRVGVVKSCGRTFQIDHQGKDSYRLKQAGAAQVLINNPQQLAFISDFEPGVELNQLIEDHFQNVDIVLVEGHKSSPHPKIAVMRQDNPRGVIPLETLNNVLACVSDGPHQQGIPHFKPHEYQAIADFIINRGEILTVNEQVAGVVLAGGKSLRLGRDKVNFKIGASTLLERTTSLLKELFEEVWVIGRKLDHELITRGIKWHLDLIQNIGPMVGIYTALKVMDKEACLVVACDMPKLNLSVLEKLLHVREKEPGADIIVGRQAALGKVEPLTAIYKKGVLSSIEGLIAERRFKISELFLQSQTRYVDFDVHEAQAFLNINTAQDWEQFCLSARKTKKI